MTPDPYDHLREAYHAVAAGLMGWEDPPEHVYSFHLRWDDQRGVSHPEKHPGTARVSEIDVEAIERLSDAAIRSGDTQTALAGYSLALRLRGEMRKWGSDE